ncbi:phage tail tube protein [Rathayibacter festucae]|uniref:Phage tail protein n=1 Tax=Rathayibacter festucae DSM 15932 TaxID=1328866 RepID=A0A3Q9UR61_9MICO|nr:phage tail tube protein [Rathayibacter festucae]AZZ51430.1 hypothetical protein C1I64_04815 [Rathayibacter festucae DSM 15932]
MPTSDQYIARREAIGLGIEATPGTPVAPQFWLHWLTQGIQPKKTTVENESAMGVVDRVNDSQITAKWVEGTIGGKVTVQSVGAMLLGMFGNVSTGAAVSGVYPHTFSNSQSSIPRTLTTCIVSPLASKRHPYTTFDNLEITAEAGGWVEVSSAVKARIGTTSTETVALASETEFTSKHVTLKVAANTGALAASTAVKANRVALTLERTSEAFFPLGTDDAPEFDRGAFEARGEFVVRLGDTQYEDDFLTNVAKAMSITIANGNDKLTFTASKVRYRELELTRDRDAVVTATVQFFCEFDTTTNSSITCLLNNTRATYAAA